MLVTRSLTGKTDAFLFRNLDQCSIRINIKRVIVREKNRLRMEFALIFMGKGSKKDTKEAKPKQMKSMIPKLLKILNMNQF